MDDAATLRKALELLAMEHGQAVANMKIVQAQALALADEVRALQLRLATLTDVSAVEESWPEEDPKLLEDSSDESE